MTSRARRLVAGGASSRAARNKAMIKPANRIGTRLSAIAPTSSVAVSPCDTMARAEVVS